MKRFGNLYELIIDKENLRIAYLNARKNKTRQYGVKLVDANPDYYIDLLHEMLVNKQYHTSKYKFETIYEPKERNLAKLPFFPDRILQHAIIRVLEQMWYNTMISSTYSCIKGRGLLKCSLDVDKAIKRRYLEGKPIYVLKFDIKKFYPSIKHDILKSIIRRKIKDKDVLYLLDDIIDSIEGVPIGNYTSQFFGNLILSPIDHYIKEDLHVKDYFRYMDDGVILSDSKEELHKILEIIKIKVAELGLEIKHTYQIFRLATSKYSKDGRGLDFVGFIRYVKHKSLRNNIKNNFKKHVFKAFKIYKYVPMQAISSYIGWIKYSNSKNLFKIVTLEKYGNFKKFRKTELYRVSWQSNCV